MPETTIRLAPEAQTLATGLIDQHHEHLQEAEILWLMTTAKRTRGGHVTLGTAARSSPLQRFLSSGNDSVQTGHDYIVQIDEGRWKRALATQRAALVDHLLCRMVRREVANKRTGEITRSWATIGPDIEEFSDVIMRHGVWLPEQQVFARAVREQGNTLKLNLPDLQDEPVDEVQTKDQGQERLTTVEPDGIVASTERVDEGAKLNQTDELIVAPIPAESIKQPGANGVEHEPGWKDTVGLGAGRRRRGTRGSESVGATP